MQTLCSCIVLAVSSVFGTCDVMCVCVAVAVVACDHSSNVCRALNVDNRAQQLIEAK
jgi:hypothetical protein